jgi:hypothetical protein
MSLQRFDEQLKRLINIWNNFTHHWYYTHYKKVRPNEINEKCGKFKKVQLPKHNLQALLRRNPIERMKRVHKS